MSKKTYDLGHLKIHEFSKSSILFESLYKNTINDLLSGISILPGGNSPKRYYELLFKRGIHNLEFLISDDRLVSNNNRLSNFKNITNALNIRVNNKYPISYFDEFNLNNLKVLNKKLDILKNKINLAILGIGNDSHTASLFPNQMLNFDNKQSGFVIKNSNENFKRFTLSYNYILSAKKIIFLVLGNDKALALNNILFEDYNPVKYPAQKIINNHNDIEIYCDSKSTLLIKNKFDESNNI